MRYSIQICSKANQGTLAHSGKLEVDRGSILLTSDRLVVRS
jgi:hypothetical protein